MQPYTVQPITLISPEGVPTQYIPIPSTQQLAHRPSLHDLTITIARGKKKKEARKQEQAQAQAQAQAQEQGQPEKKPGLLRRTLRWFFRGSSRRNKKAAETLAEAPAEAQPQNMPAAQPMSGYYVAARSVDESKMDTCPVCLRHRCLTEPHHAASPKRTTPPAENPCGGNAVGGGKSGGDTVDTSTVGGTA